MGSSGRSGTPDRADSLGWWPTDPLPFGRRNTVSAWESVRAGKPGRQGASRTERCESGRIGFTANELTWVTGSEGSNPSLSAKFCCRQSSGTVEPATGAGPGRSGPFQVRGCARAPRRPSSPAVPVRPGAPFRTRSWAVPRTPVDCSGGRAVLDRDVGLPEEPGRLGQTGGDPGRRRLRGGRSPERRRPGGGQHLCLHRGGPPGVDRHRAGLVGQPAGRVPGWWSPAAWPSATATNWPMPCPRWTWWRRSASR